MPRKRGNGDGTIYKMESKGLWAAQLTIGVDANGKPKRKTIYGQRTHLAGGIVALWLFHATHRILADQVIVKGCAKAAGQQGIVLGDH